jgi:H+/Cl- antiporter ClcA
MVKKRMVRAVIGVVVLLLAVTLLTGYAWHPFAEAEVPLLDFGWELILVFFWWVPVLVLLGLVVLIFFHKVDICMGIP